ncbi:MAG: hypothetical protein WEB79_03605 [Thermoleophilaceae bacterium]
MHDQRTPTPAERDDQIDGAILAFLLDRPALRAADEVAREVGDEIAAADGLGRLARAGLIHRLDRFVFASQAAERGQRLAL